MYHDEQAEASCVGLADLSGAALMVAADGEADDATLAHLLGCPACAARVEQLRALQRTLRRQLYRLFCPATDLLVDYCHGLADPAQRAIVSHHIALCPACAEELALLECGDPLLDRLAPTGRHRPVYRVGRSY